MQDPVTAEMGHNVPPAALDETFENLAARTKTLTVTGNMWIAERPEILDEDAAGKATTFVKQVNEHRKKCEAERKARNEPHRDEIKINDALFKGLTRQLEIAATAVKASLAAYLTKKEFAAKKARDKAESEALAKIEAAEAAATVDTGDAIGDAVRLEQATEEADAAVKAAEKAAKPASVQSDLGQTASTRTTTTFEIIDHRAVDLEALRLHFSPDAIDKAIRNFIKHGGRELRGVRIFETTSAVVR